MRYRQTVGVIVDEIERRRLVDLQDALERLFPRRDRYDHDTIDDNADAHLRATIL